MSAWEHASDAFWNGTRQIRSRVDRGIETGDGAQVYVGSISLIDCGASVASRRVGRLERLPDSHGYRAFKVRVGYVCSHDVGKRPGRTEELIPAVRVTISDEWLATANREVRERE